MRRELLPVAVMLGAAAAVLAAPARGQQPAGRFQEHVDVSRVVVDARVIGPSGRPLTSLSAADFRVLVDGAPVRLESAEWVSAPDLTGSDRGEPAPAPAPAAAPAHGPGRGRLIVFFFQKDLTSVRLIGLMRMKQRAAAMVDALAPGDRVAVLTYDSHLKLWLDFTGDRAALHRVVEHAILFDDEPAHVRAGTPSLLPSYDRRAARRAATADRGLYVLARALAPIEGAKSLVFFGWGLGTYTPPFVRLGRDYQLARFTLAASRVTVYALDLTDADSHTLEVGLEQIAADTGGLYAKTHLFPDGAMHEVAQALSGHYELVFEGPSGHRGAHAVKVEVVGVRGTVFARGLYED